MPKIIFAETAYFHVRHFLMHSSSETQFFFKNLVLEKGKGNQKKSRIEVSMLMTFPRENIFF